MRLAHAIGLLAALAPAAIVSGQEQDGKVLLELRVVGGSGDGSVTIDRGARHGIAVGDQVLFRPRGGGLYKGHVLEVEELTARVELEQAQVTLAPGTRGEVRVRPPEGESEGEGQQAVEEAPESAPPVEQGEQVAPGREDGWTPDMPLLARVKSQRPEEREKSMRGRIYFTTDNIFATDDKRTDSYFRLGTELVYENPFERGGRLHIDGELDYQVLDLPDEADDGGSKLRLDRLSYAWGGTRFAPEGWEVGRFLQRGMPEFGVLDGIQYVRRFDNGDRLGASFGYLPEPDPDQHTGDDISIAGFYQWVSDLAEQLQITAGYQKTLHKGTSDRDLFVGKVHYAPTDSPWSAYFTSWVDYYDSRDDLKSSSLELTQAVGSLRHRWESGNEVELSFRRMLFPEIEREEFRLVEEREITDGHHDRVAADGWVHLTSAWRTHAGMGLWFDEDESGADAVLGSEFRDLLLAASLLDCSVFGQAGEFESVVGVRALLARTTDNPWDLFYEISNHHELGFLDDRDDILQHRLRASRDFGYVRGWRVSCYLESVLYDDEVAFLLGAYVQREVSR